MQHPDEHTIDLYVVRSLRLTDGERATMRSHLAACPECAQLAMRLEEFYQDLASFPAVAESSTTEVLARSRDNSVVLRLVPYRPRPDTAGLRLGYSTVLAAMTGRDHTLHLNETVATLAAEADRTLVRIRREDRAHKYRLYVHTEDPARRDGMVVTIPGLGDFVVDEQGQVEFEVREEEEPQDWSLLEAVARIPVTTLDISPDRIREGITSDMVGTSLWGPVTLNYSWSSGMLAIEGRLPEGAGTLKFAVCRVPGERPVMVLLQGGKGSVAFPPSQRPLQVRLYQ